MSYFGGYFGGGGAGGSGDTVAPIITIVSPTPGVAPGSPGGFPASVAAAALTPIVIDVTDADPGNQIVVIAARFAGVAATEVVYMDGAFFGNYVTGSTQVAITDGVRLSCMRVGGWPSAPTFNIEAVDAAGNLTA